MRHWMKRRMMGRRHGFQGGFGRWMGPGMGGGRDYQDRLAEALGIGVDELQAAKQTARKQAIQEAVDEGELAPKHAQRMLAAMKLRETVDFQDLAAQVLEMTPEQLEQARADGQSWRELMRERGLKPWTARQRLMEAGKARLDQAVADGVLSQEEADQLWTMRGRGRGPFGRRHGRHGRHHGRGRCGHGHEGHRAEDDLPLDAI